MNTEEDQAVELLVEVLGAVVKDDPLPASPPSSNHGNDAESKEDRGAERQQAGAPPLGVGNPSGHQHGEERPDDQVAQPRRLSHLVSMRGVQRWTRAPTRGGTPEPASRSDRGAHRAGCSGRATRLRQVAVRGSVRRRVCAAGPAAAVDSACRSAHG